MYIIQEIQTNNGQTSLLPAITKEDKLAAESEWHTKMGYAAISDVQVHTVIMYDEHGNMIRNGYYEHIPEVTNESEESAGSS